MIFINHVKNGKKAKDYYAHLSRDDYFAKDAERLAPRYEGKAAERMGIAGKIADQESFFALCDNKNPMTGEKITPHSKEGRRTFTDLTFDVPKSVSLAALVDDRINGMVDQSVGDTMEELEREASVRVRKDEKDEDRVTGNLMWVMWSHETARPLKDGTVDPHKHRHVTVINNSYDQVEGIYKAVQLGSIVRDKGYYQAAYHARLAHRLAEAGYGIERDGNSFRLVGIEKGLTEKFSRRTAVIEKEAERLGIEDASAKAKLGRRTRNKKGSEVGTEALRQEWLGRMTEEERQSLTDAGKAGNGQKIDTHEAFDYAVEHSFVRRSVVSERKVKAEALNYAVGSVLPDEIDKLATQSPILVRVQKDGQRMATTREVLKSERTMLQYAREARGQYKPFVEKGTPVDLGELSKEQQKAARSILQSRDGITGVLGGAGTGKTRMMKDTIAAIEQNGNQVFVFAPSSQASRGVLKAEGFQNADTLEALLRNEKTQGQVRGQVIWVDEAGMIGTRDMNRLIGVAKKQQARLILSGDFRQHGSVQAGDAFRVLEAEGGVKYAQLREIRRQTNADYKKAVEAIDKGGRKGLQEGFKILDKKGWIVEKQGEERHRALVADYIEAVDKKKSALIIAPTHKEADVLTQEVRNELRMRGEIQGKEHAFVTRKAMNLTDAQKRDLRNYEKGQVVEFYQNAKQGFTRGDCAVVVGKKDGKIEVLKTNGTRALLPDQVERYQVFHPEEMRIAKGERIRLTQNGKVQSESGKEVRVNNGDVFTVDGYTRDGDIKLAGGKVLPKTYGHFAFGYVDTSHASQGKTVDRVYIAAGDASVLAVNSQQWYVSVSRGREMAKVYVDSKEQIEEAITRNVERMSAVELVKGTKYEEQKQRSEEMLERARASRYWKERQALKEETRRKGRAYGG